MFCNARYARSMARVSRRDREHELVQAARRLFDERGGLDAPIDEVARAAGINKALIYRHFASKEELQVHALVEYLAELGDRLEEPVTGDAWVRLAEVARRFARFGLDYPAFASSALALMREPVAELRGRVSEGVLVRLGEAMARCLRVLARVLAELDVEDADLLANVLYARSLGLVHLARLGAGVRTGAQGMPELFPIAPDEVERQCVDDALACAARRGGVLKEVS